MSCHVRLLLPLPLHWSRLNSGWLGRRCLQLELFFSTGTAHACGQISLSRLGLGVGVGVNSGCLLAVGGTKDHGVMVFWFRQGSQKMGEQKSVVPKIKKTNRFFLTVPLLQSFIFCTSILMQTVIFIWEFPLTHLEPPKFHRFLKLTLQVRPRK